MNNVIKSIKLDNYILKNYYIPLLMVYLIGSVIAIVSQIPVLTVALVVVISAPFFCTFFSVYEKNNLNKLYGTLPIGKKVVVFGRYIFALLFIIINGIISGTLSFIISFFVNSKISNFDSLAILSVAFLYCCFFISILLPVYFKFAFSKVYIFANLPMYLVVVATLLIARKTDFLKNIAPVIQYFTNNQNMVWITGVGVGLILICISVPISIVVSKGNEL